MVTLPESSCLRRWVAEVAVRSHVLWEMLRQKESAYAPMRRCALTCTHLHTYWWSGGLGDDRLAFITHWLTDELQVVSVTMEERHQFLILASDGVWEFMTNKMVVDTVARFSEPVAACRQVVRHRRTSLLTSLLDDHALCEFVACR